MHSWRASSSYTTRFRKGSPSDFSPDLRSEQVSCGLTEGYAGVTCAVRKPGGTWRLATPHLHARCRRQRGRTRQRLPRRVLGPLARLHRRRRNALRSSDVAKTLYGSFYEIAGVGTESPQLRLVNVDNSGKQLNINPSIGEGPAARGQLGLHQRHRLSCYLSEREDGVLHRDAARRRTDPVRA